MRATLLLLMMLIAASVPAAAQPAFSQDQPRPTFGIGVGVSDDGNWSGNEKNLLLSATYEVPLGDWARVRLEAARTRQAIPALVYRTNVGDMARFTRLTLSLAGVNRSLAPIAPYGGLGIGFYRATFDRASASGWRVGPYVHGGIEVQAGDTVAIDGEIGVHVIGGHFYPGSGLLGEALVRIKIGL
jgi:Outer membrane protein beta-barrel domain